MIKQYILFVTFFISFFGFAQNRVQLEMCLESDSQLIPSSTLDQLIQPYIPNNEENGTIYLITNDGKAEKIVDLFSDPTIEPVCPSIPNLNEIGIDRDKNLVFARSNGFIFKVREDNCTQILGQSISANQTVYAMALDKNNSIYIDNANRNANTHSIYRSLYNSATNSNLPFQPFITLTEGEPNGDMITIGKSIYSSWKYQGSFYLYEFILDDNYNYTGIFHNWGRLTYQGLSLDFFGMASEFGRLFGVTNTNDLYEIVLNPQTRTFENRLVLRRGNNNVKWIGAAGLNEANEYTYNYFYDLALTEPIQLPLSANDPLIRNNQIYATITDSNTGNVIVITIDLRLSVKPIVQDISVIACRSDNGDYQINLGDYQSQITQNNSVRFSYFNTESDALTDRNSITSSVSVSNDTNFYVRVESGNNCFAIAKIVVHITSNMPLVEDFTICSTPVNVTISNSYSSYVWKKDGEIISTDSTITISEIGAYELIVTTQDQCIISSEFTVTNGDGPIINSVQISGNTVTIFAIEQNLMYSIDGINYSTSNIFSNLTDSTYEIYVKNSSGCITTRTIYLSKAFNFISPNFDSKNDEFKIYGFESNPNATIKIFDRYGKVILSGLLINVLPWNGKINGKTLPSDSYWYMVTENDIVLDSGYIVLKNSY